MTQMTENKRHQNKTDRAWIKLYDRLEREQLINPKTVVMRKNRLLMSRIKVAVIAIFMCLAGTLTYVFTNNEKSNSKDRITMENTDKSYTLVTTLKDGSVIYLSDNTTLSFPASFDKSTREVELKGNAQFDVAGNPDHPFIIDTKSLRIEVIGTAFQVQSGAESNYNVAVMRGKVKVTVKKSGESVFVEAGESVKLSDNRLMFQGMPSDLNILTHRMRFKDESLINILSVINKHTEALQIEASPALANRLLTVTFSDDSPDLMVELICGALNIKHTKENNKIFLFE